MSLRQERNAAKRRIMFIAGEDFYFLAYTLFIVLSDLGANSAEKEFIDPRKIAYIADMIGSDSDLHLVTSNAPLSPSGRSRLAVLYDRAVSRRVPVERLLEALAKRGWIAVSRDPAHSDRDRVCLIQTEQVVTMLENPLFKAERNRIKQLRQLLPQLRTMTLATLRQRIFDDRGVRTWGG